MNTLNDDLIAEVLARKSRSAVPPVATSRDDEGVQSSPAEMKERFSRCLSDAASNVFTTMCGMPLLQDDALQPDEVIDQSHISGIISISGNFKSNVILNLRSDVVFAAADAMLGMKTDVIDHDVLDLVRELTNMVAGNAKDRLSMDGVSLGLPTVVAGSGHRVALKSDLAIELIRFRSDAGPLLIEFCVQ